MTTATALDLFVRGVPKTQGSMTTFRGKVTHAEPADLAHWRGLVFADCRTAWGVGREPMDGPLRVELDFYVVTNLKRRYPVNVSELPPLHGIVQSVRPLYVTGLPTHWAAFNGRLDIDKLARAVLDGVGFAKVWVDDGLVCELVCRKYYAAPPELPPGVRIRIEAIAPA